MATAPKPVYSGDVPTIVLDRFRAICSALPDAYEEPAWVGVRWRVRKKTFAHVLVVDFHGDGTDRRIVLTFNAEGDDLEALSKVGPPFRKLGWGRHAMAVDISTRTDWKEIEEIVTDSFCVVAPKKLVKLVSRPDAT